MRLSVFTDYSFRVLMQAALRWPERVTVDEVVDTFGISRHHLVKVVHDLGRNGYLRTHLVHALARLTPKPPPFACAIVPIIPKRGLGQVELTCVKSEVEASEYCSSYDLS